MTDQPEEYPKTVDRPVFILGLGRSGTSMLRATLNRHPELAIAPETHFLDQWVQKHWFTDISDPSGFDVFWTQFESSQHFKSLGLDPAVARSETETDHRTFKRVFTSILSQYANKEGKSRAGEKTPAHYRFIRLLLGWYPDARILFVIRDPRAVAASFLNQKADWANLRVDEIARRWKRSAQTASRWASHSQVRIVRYEDIVRNPEEELSRLCRFVEVPYSSELLYSRFPKEKWIDDVAAISPNAPILDHSLVKWKHQLKARHIRVIEHIARAEMIEFDYEPSGDDIRPSDRLELLGSGLKREYGRLARVGRHPVSAARRVFQRRSLQLGRSPHATGE